MAEPPDATWRRRALRRKNRITFALIAAFVVTVYLVFMIRAGGF